MEIPENYNRANLVNSYKVCLMVGDFPDNKPQRILNAVVAKEVKAGPADLTQLREQLDDLYRRLSDYQVHEETKKER